MFARIHQFLLVLLVLVSGTTLQAEESTKRECPLEVVEGKFTMITDRKYRWLERFAIEAMGTKPEDMEAIKKHPTVGNFETKFTDKESHDLEITMDTLLGKITTRIKPREWGDSNVNGEIAWLDGRKYSVNFMRKFFPLGKYRSNPMNWIMGNQSSGFWMHFGKENTKWNVQWIYSHPKLSELGLKWNYTMV